VTTLLADDQATLARFEHGHDDAFDKAAGWLYEGRNAPGSPGRRRAASSPPRRRPCRPGR
jgi:aminopeptidase